MDIKFSCPVCGQNLAMDAQAKGETIPCPVCGKSLVVPSPQELPIDPALVLSEDDPRLSCPVCWLPFSIGDIMHIATHDSLRGDPVLGEDAPQRFHATRFNNLGQALDAMGSACSTLACPHCRRKLPPGFLDAPHHIFSLVGDQSAGKSYYLSVLSKVLPSCLFTGFNVTMQDADPSGNGPLNEMKKVLFSAQAPAQAKLAKTQLEGSMYERLPRLGRMVALPKPFIYSLASANGKPDRCSIIFYDNAGEHFQPGINIVEQPGAQHVASAAGILFLFDPFNSPEFRKRITAANDPQLEKPALDQQDTLLAEMRSRIQEIRHLPIDGQIDTPLAFLVGKCDAWLELMESNPLENPLRNSYLDLSVVRRNSQRIRALLYEICPAVVANAEYLSKRVCFFAVSAFGHTPVKIGPGDFVPDPARLSPMQVEVPALWLISQICPSLVPSRDLANPVVMEPVPITSS